MNLADELERLHALFVGGAMTADEYQKAKTKLLKGEGSPEAAKNNPAPFDWANVAEQPPTGEAPIRSGKVTEKDALKALEWGAVGGAIIGVALTFANGSPFWPAVIGATFAGAIVWSALSLGVKAMERSRGFAALLLHLLYVAAIVVYGVALLYLLGLAIYVKLRLGQPRYEEYHPPADLGDLLKPSDAGWGGHEGTFRVLFGRRR